MLNIHGGNRDEWEFEYTASKLAEGAIAQKQFRESRVAWWTDTYNKVMAEIKEAGILVTESSAVGSSSYANTKAIAPSASIDQRLQAKLTEAHTKIQQHQHGAAEYDGWIQVLSANPEARLKLTQADWLYFFGKA
jgi:histidinol-phosphate/aromatic aminotransferase/cobyric acid decarboxylase-like protein